MSKQLSVLFLCGWYPSRVFPTNGDYIERHATTVAITHKVTVIHIVTDEKSTQNINYDEIISGNLTTHIAYIRKTNFLKKIYLFIKAFLFLLKKVAFIDIVHVNEIYPFGIFALYLKAKKNIPFIISEHWTGYLKNRSKKIGLLHKSIAKKIVKSAAFVCPVSTQLKENMTALGLKGNYVVIGNVVDTNLFSIANKQKEKSFNIIHVSNLLDEQKNISGIIRVAKRLENEIENLTFTFIGGSSKNYINLINKLNFKTDTLKFVKHISQKEVANYLQKSNLFVSFSNYETFGIVMLEAIACGLPVISTNTGVLTELEKKDFFSIIPVSDENKLYNEILNFKKIDKQHNKNEMNNFVEKLYAKPVILSAFSELYIKALKDINAFN